ncbi:hypothetical protein MSAN_02275200 [Mycena sanguinolenta]|uniref:Ricin B lectin domain-containing protein n=1 Tax=Mycena sanguinolenta TaxID=230812 RepID=A0A8H7CJ22_9AGAR|nr:hypothetical protein MSAN_02275200 [Mycena sanguinolenta]
MVAPICFLLAVVLITNFQGNVLHVANDINPTARPIVTMPPAVPTIGNEKWTFVPIFDSNDTQFVVQSSQQAQPSQNIFIGYQTAISEFVQASGVGDPIFTLKCINSTAGAMIENFSGNALTAWPGVSAPVTYETFTGAPNQIWNFVAA